MQYTALYTRQAYILCKTWRMDFAGRTRTACALYVVYSSPRVEVSGAKPVISEETGD